MAGGTPEPLVHHRQKIQGSRSLDQRIRSARLSLLPVTISEKPIPRCWLLIAQPPARVPAEPQKPFTANGVVAQIDAITTCSGGHRRRRRPVAALRSRQMVRVYPVACGNHPGFEASRTNREKGIEIQASVGL